MDVVRFSPDGSPAEAAAGSPASGSPTAGSPTAVPSLLDPGVARAGQAVSDAAVFRALAFVEAAWVRARGEIGLIDPTEANDLATSLLSLEVPPAPALEMAASAGGNPVIGFLAHVRHTLAGHPHLSLLHTGLTSQDVLDTALMVLVDAWCARLRDEVGRIAGRLEALSEAHTHTLVAARTLTQPALPTTFGLRVSQWRAGLVRATNALPRTLPVQAGGAAGTRASYVEVAGSKKKTDALVAAWAQACGLHDAPAWQTERTRIIGIGAGLAGITAAASRIAQDVLAGARFEIGELREGSGGGSSAMPQKSNPTRAVLLNRNGMRAPAPLSTLALAAGQAVDDRPDGSWHAEWPALSELASLALQSTSLLEDLVTGLVVDASRMRSNLDAVGPALMSERLPLSLAGLLTKAQVADAITAATASGTELEEELRTRLGEHAGEVDLAALLAPENYLGDSEGLRRANCALALDVHDDLAPDHPRKDLP